MYYSILSHEDYCRYFGDVINYGQMLPANCEHFNDDSYSIFKVDDEYLVCKRTANRDYTQWESRTFYKCDHMDGLKILEEEGKEGKVPSMEELRRKFLGEEKITEININLESDTETQEEFVTKNKLGKTIIRKEGKDIGAQG